MTIELYADAVALAAAKLIAKHVREAVASRGRFVMAVRGGEVADGVQVFRFWDGRWRLTDAARKYNLWASVLGSAELAKRLYGAALNLAEDRRGGLFVVLDNPTNAGSLVAKSDVLSSVFGRSQHSAVHTDCVVGTKDQLHYPLSNKRVLDIPVSVLHSVS